MRQAMTILADTSIANHALVLSTADRISDDDLIDRIQRELTAGTAHYILAGRDFIELKDRLRGRFIEVVELKFDMSIDVIEIWMNIARAFPDPARWQFLPSAYTTLNMLTRIPQETRDLWIDEEKINRRTTWARAKDLVEECQTLAEIDRDDDGDDDARDADAGGNDHQDDGDHSEQRADTQPTDQTVTRENIGADSNEVERLKAHIEDLEAYIERLEAEAEHSESENELLKRRNAELEAMIGFDVGRNQRSILSHAIETAQEAIKSKDDSNERRRLQADAGAYVLDIVRTARRDGLDVERFDLAYRPRPEEKLTKGEESSAPLGADAQLQAGG
jgi:hypothetical protein